MKFTDSSGKTIALPADKDIAWRISGYAVVKNNLGQFLMVQSGSGLWHFPGGGIEVQEEISQGVARECLEETGYKMAVSPQVLHTNEQYFYHSREQEFYHSIQLFFEAHLLDDEPDTSFVTGHDAERQSKWLNPSTLKPAELHPTVRELAKKL